MNKKICGILLLSIILLVPFAFATKTLAESYVTETGNHYIGDDNVRVTTPIEGDLVTGGNEVIISQKVQDNLIAGGRTVLVEEDIVGDVWIAGGYVVINGNIGGDLRVTGGEIYINSEQIQGDVILFGGKVSIAEGTQILGEELFNVGKEVRNVTDNPTDLSKAEDSIGNVGDSISAAISGISGALTAVSIVFSVLMLISGIVASYFILRIFPVFSEEVLLTIEKEPFKSIVFGIGALVAGPFVVIILLVSIVGIKLLALFFLLALLASMFAQTYVKYLVGRLILKQMEKNKTGRLLPLVMGSLLVWLILFVFSFIPGGWFISALINLGITSIGIGAILVNKFKALD